MTCHDDGDHEKSLGLKSYNKNYLGVMTLKVGYKSLIHTKLLYSSFIYFI